MHEDYLAPLHSQIITCLGYRRLMVSEAFGFFLDYIFEVHAQCLTALIQFTIIHYIEFVLLIHYVAINALFV